MDHTPGPWRVEHGTSCYIYADEAHHIGPICSMRSRLDYPAMNPKVADTLDANAHLIAAAPDLLYALVQLLDQDDHGECEIWVRNKARAAIRKALGELA